MKGVRISSLDEIRANFNPEQMLSFYRSGRLQKWLEEQGEIDKLEIINGFEKGCDDAANLNNLMTVFELNEEQKAIVEKQYKGSEEQRNKDDNPTQTPQQTPLDTGRLCKDKKENEKCWHICKLPKEISPDSSHFEASSKSISNDELTSGNLKFYNPQSIYFFCITQTFSFNGCIWAMLKSPRSLKKLWVKSTDGIAWDKDDELCTLLHNSDFQIGRIKVTPELVFIISSSHSDSVLVFSSDEGWTEKEYKEWGTSKLEDVYDGNGYFGVIRYNPKSNGCEHKVFARSSILDNDKHFTRLTKYNYTSDYYYDDAVKAYVYKEYLFVKNTNNYSGKFVYADLDEKEPDFHDLRGNIGNITVDSSSKACVFKDVIFILGNGGAIYSIDGLKWKQCGIDAAKVIDIVFVGNRYFAVCDNDHEYYPISLWSSDTGERWDKIQHLKFCFRATPSVAVAGNNTLIFHNGSESGNYLMYRVPTH